MRTAVVFLLFFSSLPFALSYTWVAPLAYVTMSVLNPHKLTYGAALYFPFAQIAAITSIFLLVLSKDRRWLPNHPLVYLLIALYLWMGITTLVSINPEARVWTQWFEVSKTYLMLIVLALLIYEKNSIQALVLVLVGSIAFYGFKGGIFTILTGGSERVWGAPGSVIHGNNEIGLGLVMIVPFLTYYYGLSRSFLGRMGIAMLIALCFVAVLGTQSRGAAVALGAMAFFLSAKSKHPFVAVGGLILASLLAFMLMPDSWTDRMMTITNHEGDGSAMSRLSTWQMILNLASDRPIVGAGFALDNTMIYLKYHASYQIGDIPYGPHSIYFQALGEHGFVGFSLYVSLLISTWWTFGKLANRFKAIETEQWAAQLCRMAQVGLLGFCAGGAFLGLMHWDVPFYLVALCIILVRYASQFEEQAIAPDASGAPIGLRYSRNSGFG
jgi:putative inorganic carbon (hco3(-)) transporter